MLFIKDIKQLHQTSHFFSKKRVLKSSGSLPLFPNPAICWHFFLRAPFSSSVAGFVWGTNFKNLKLISLFLNAGVLYILHSSSGSSHIFTCSLMGGIFRSECMVLIPHRWLLPSAFLALWKRHNKPCTNTGGKKASLRVKKPLIYPQHPLAPCSSIQKCQQPINAAFRQPLWVHLHKFV